MKGYISRWSWWECVCDSEW